MRMFPRRCVKKCKGFWMKIIDWVLCLILGKVVKDVAVIYATLIIKGLKKFSDVPNVLKDQVREILIACDCGELAE